jgi:hypothetical protein
MRLISTILSALSLVLFVVATVFWVRSFMRFEGVLHFSDSEPVKATMRGEGESMTAEVRGRSTGWISYRGRLTYLSIANPLRSAGWESWSEPADAPAGMGPMMLAWEARNQSGLAGGTTQTQFALRDPIEPKISWLLPYRYFTLPYWLLAVLFGILPYRWGMRRWGRRPSH